MTFDSWGECAWSACQAGTLAPSLLIHRQSELCELRVQGWFLLERERMTKTTCTWYSFTFTAWSLPGECHTNACYFLISPLRPWLLSHIQCFLDCFWRLLVESLLTRYCTEYCYKFNSDNWELVKNCKAKASQLPQAAVCDRKSIEMHFLKS
jgi:hypothetical protein